MIIYGAGMAGLLAGHYLRRFSPAIYEAQPELPNNHAALLRFRSDAVSKVTNIPFKQVKVHKLVSHAGRLYDQPNLKLTNMYSQKVTGKIMDRSIGNLAPVERYIAPDDFIAQLSRGLNIEYDNGLTPEDLRAQKMAVQNEMAMPIISTIPMNIMMDIVGWEHKPEFNYKPIISVWGKIKSPQMNVYNTVYYPDFTDDYYRISITGDVVIAEYLGKDAMIETMTGPTDFPADRIAGIQHDIAACLAREFGIYDVEFETFNIKHQKYGKLLPIDEHIRKEFIMYLTDTYRIYSLGRFATWRQILMDDVVDDLKIVEQMLEHRDRYNQRKNLR